MLKRFFALLLLGLVGSYALPTEAQGSVTIEPPDGWVVTAQEGNLIEFATSEDVELFPQSGEASIRIIRDDGKGAWALSPTDDNLEAVAAYQYGVTFGLSLMIGRETGTLPTITTPKLQPLDLEGTEIVGYMLTGQTLSDHAIIVVSKPRAMFILSSGLGEMSDYVTDFFDVIGQLGQ